MSAPHTAPWDSAARELVARLADQSAAERVRFTVPTDPHDSPHGDEHYTLRSDAQGIEVTATTGSAALRAVGEFLTRHGVHIGLWSSQGDVRALLEAAPEVVLEGGTPLPHRFALNDTEDGYAGPYRSFDAWEHLIDVLALQGYNEFFVSVGTEEVYRRLLIEHGYSSEEALAWIPLPARQPWWLLQNMDSYLPGMTEELSAWRAELGRRITDRLRALSLTPVLPGYAGSVPRDFAQRNPGATTIDQGLWCGVEQPAWLDPTTAEYSACAAEYYRIQEDVLGSTTMVKMDLLHEGGSAEGVDVTEAVRAVDRALQEARPGAYWAVLGWLDNPTPEMVAGFDPTRTIVIDGVADRYPALDRPRDWAGLPHLYGSIWNFGGHLTLGAWVEVWNREFWERRTASDSTLAGIAYIPEASGGNPFATTVLAGLPWRTQGQTLAEQAVEFADEHYGTADDSARAAWERIAQTCYVRCVDEFSCPHEGLFTSAPGLDRQCASNWQPMAAGYDRLELARAVPLLLDAAPAVQATDTYAEDLVALVRQVLSDCSRAWLPQIAQAVADQDVTRYDALTRQWLRAIDQLDTLMGTRREGLLGAYLADSEHVAHLMDPALARQDMRGLLTFWLGDGDLLDYTNREWNGLLSSYYRPRWKLFFQDVREELLHGVDRPERDWDQFGRDWSARDDSPAPAADPTGDAVTVARETWQWILSHDPEVADAISG